MKISGTVGEDLQTARGLPRSLIYSEIIIFYNATSVTSDYRIQNVPLLSILNARDRQSTFYALPARLT